MRWRRSHRGQSGASLVLVLGIVAFLAAMTPAVLGIALTGLLVSKPVMEDRGETYAATSAIDAAIALGQTDPDIGVPGGPCPSQELVIDGMDVLVDCSSFPLPDNGCYYVDRFVTYVAEVRRSGDSDVLARYSAEVVYRFVPDGPAKAEIRQFTPSALGPVTTTPLPTCSAATSTTTSTTTTTQPVPEPLIGSYSEWVETASAKQGSNWRGEATLEVRSQTGAPLENAVVNVRVEYLQGATWTLGTSIPAGASTSTGAVTFHSPYYKRTGANAVTAVRFTITGVAYPGLNWIAAAHPVTVQVAQG